MLLQTLDSLSYTYPHLVSSTPLVDIFIQPYFPQPKVLSSPKTLLFLHFKIYHSATPNTVDHGNPSLVHSLLDKLPIIDCTKLLLKKCLLSLCFRKTFHKLLANEQFLSTCKVIFVSKHNGYMPNDLLNAILFSFVIKLSCATRHMNGLNQHPNWIHITILTHHSHLVSTSQTNRKFLTCRVMSIQRVTLERGG